MGKFFKKAGEWIVYIGLSILVLALARIALILSKAIILDKIG